MPGVAHPCAIPAEGISYPCVTPVEGEVGALELNPADIELLVALQGNV
jgi:hypothetical protein